MPRDGTEGNPAPSDYARTLGARLREVRAEQHLSLHGVERKSDGRWKAVVVGSYERGDRAISVERLAELATFYDVPIADLLPRQGPTGAAGREPRAAAASLAKVVLNLPRLTALKDPDATQLARFVAAIQRHRGTLGSAALSIRRDDMRTLALIYDTSEDGITERLVRWQVLAPDSVILDGEP